MFALHQLLQESLKANPESTVEVFKRMLAIKMMLKRPDDPAFASVLCVSCAYGLFIYVVQTVDLATLQ
jgi:hypothetical protein